MDLLTAATILLVLVTLGTVMMAYFMLRAHVDPHVIVYSKHDEDRPSVLMVIIENIGQGVAYNVRFQLDRSVPARAWGIEKPNEESKPMEEGPLITGIPLLAPRERRVIDWGQYGGLSQAIRNRPIRVRATYESRRLRPWDPTEHITDSVLEVESFHKTNASGSVEREQAKAVAAIAKEMKKLTSQAKTLIGRLHPTETDPKKLAEQLWPDFVSAVRAAMGELEEQEPRELEGRHEVKAQAKPEADDREGDDVPN